MSTLACNTQNDSHNRLTRFLKKIDYFTHFYNSRSCPLIDNPQSYLQAMARYYPESIVEIDMYLDIRYLHEQSPSQAYKVRSQASKLADMFKKSHQRYGFIFVRHEYTRGSHHWAHANLLILAYETRKIHLYEPHGCPRVNMSQGIKRFFDIVLSDKRLAYHQWRFDDLRPPVNDSGKYINGLQTQGRNAHEPFGTCILWCLFVANQLATQKGSITRVMNTLYKSENIREQLVDFLEHAWSTYFENVPCARYDVIEQLTFSNMNCRINRPRDAPLVILT